MQTVTWWTHELVPSEGWRVWQWERQGTLFATRELIGERLMANERDDLTDATAWWLVAQMVTAQRSTTDPESRP